MATLLKIIKDCVDISNHTTRLMLNSRFRRFSENHGWSIAYLDIKLQ